MKRLTSDSPKGNYGNILNLFYVRDQAAWVRGGGSAPAYEDVSLYDFARQIISAHIPNADTVVSDDILDEIMAEWLLDGPETKEGLIALLYNAAWAFADLRERLSAYEDTGMEPEEITTLHRAHDIVIGLYGVPCGVMPERLRNLAQADKDGRLVVLPCKVGDLVWVTMAYGKQFDQPVQGYVRWFKLYDDELMHLETGIWMDIGDGKKDYGYSVDSFGKIVHLTHEEAETALAEKGESHEA